MRTISAVVLALLCACAPTMYWTRADTPLRTVAADLFDCRTAATRGGDQVFSPEALERPCMVSKGYALSRRPPQ